MEYPGELFYTREHTWARTENGKCYIGITSYAQDQLGEIVYVDLPAVGERVEQMDTFGAVESVKAVSDLFAPVSGEVVEVNEALEEAPDIINSDPYGEGWMIAVLMTDENELDDLMSADEYRQMVEGL